MIAKFASKPWFYEIQVPTLLSAQNHDANKLPNYFSGKVKNLILDTQTSAISIFIRYTTHKLSIKARERVIGC